MKFRKGFKPLLSIVLSIALSLMLIPGFISNAEGENLQGSVVILHTNDVHGAISDYAKIAALEDSYEAKGAEVILMDAGDFIQGSIYVSSSKGASAVQMMNEVGYDVAVMGNHELDYGFDNLKQISKNMAFKFLCATMTDQSGNPVFDANTIIETNAGVKIGVFGINTPHTMTATNPANIKGLRFARDNELVDICNKQVRALSDAGCNYIVCLGHMGIEDELTGNRSVDVISKVPGIDLFIDGHSHSTLDQEKEALSKINIASATSITSTGTKLENIGAVTITPNSTGDYDTSCEMISAKELPKDSEIAAKAQAITNEVDSLYGEVIGKSEVDLDGARETVRAKESNLGNLITDAMRWKLKELEGVDGAAIENGGGIRASIPAGNITKKDVLNVLPFFNTLAVVKVKGKELLNALEASTYSVPETVGAFPQVSGIEYTIDTSAPFVAGNEYPDSTYKAPASINRVTIHTVGGHPFNPDETYTLVVNDFMASGGDSYYGFKNADVCYDTGESLDQVVCDYIREVLGGVIKADMYAPAANRIKIIYEAPNETPVKTYTVSRLYSLSNGDHFYASYAPEADDAAKNSGYNIEARSYFSVNGTGSEIYRAYCPTNGDHFYTANKSEWENARKCGYVTEGVAFISSKTGRAVYRLYNLKNGDHFYTTSAAERDSAIKACGYADEGIAFYAD